jgi:hypothetical protein
MMDGYLIGHPGDALEEWGSEINGRVDDCEQQSVDQVECGRLLSSAMADLHEILTSANIVEDALENLGRDAILPDEQPWHAHTIHEKGPIWIGLVRISRYRPVPLHDHPGSYGALSWFRAGFISGSTSRWRRRMARAC